MNITEFKNMPKKGIALIAKQNLPKGSLVSSAITYRLDSEQLEQIRDLDLYKFIFFNPEIYKQRKLSASDFGYLAFGSMSWCNHSANPTAKIIWNLIDNDCYELQLFTIKSVQAGDEITVTYANINEYDESSWEK